MKIHAALIIHIHASPDVADLWLDNVGDDSLSLLQLRAQGEEHGPNGYTGSGIEECVLVEGDAVSASWAIAYDASDTSRAQEYLSPGGSGTPVQSFEECYQWVKSMNDLAIRLNQPPTCYGLSLPTGGQGQCYCQREISNTDGNPDWQSCKFGGFTEADLFPGNDQKAAEALGCFFLDRGAPNPSIPWGNPRNPDPNVHEVKASSSASSKAECINLCVAMGANGVTMDRRTPSAMSRWGAACFCYSGQQTQRNSAAYENCIVGAPAPAPRVDGVGFDGSCSWQRGKNDGRGGPSYRDTVTPKARSPEHCAQMVRQQCPDANAAELRVSGSGECFCMFNSVREQCIPESNEWMNGPRTSASPTLNCPAETTWMSCNTLQITTTTTSTTTAEAGDAAVAVGDPHLVDSTNGRSDLCCHHGVCRSCDA